MRFAVIAASCCACAAESTPTGSIAQSIVYGDDDRVDLYEAKEPLARLATNSAVALIAPEFLRPVDNGRYAIDAPAYGEVQSLCPGERFFDQPAAASCSGLLVAPDIVATAGHCLGVAADGSPLCNSDRYVIGFGIADHLSPIVIDAGDIFECSQVLAWAKTSPDSSCRFDLVLVRLSREARPRTSIAPIREQPVDASESVAVIGFPAGLPVKIDLGARVMDARSSHDDFFTLSSDTFAASSGSGVFDEEGRVVGLFARGRLDYDDTAGCRTVHREPNDDAPGYEEATHAGALRTLLEVAASPDGGTNASRACDVLEHIKLAAPYPHGSSGCSIGPTGLTKTQPLRCAIVIVAAIAYLRMRSVARV